MTRQEMRLKLEALRRTLEPKFAAAEARGDTAEMARLEGIAGEIDDVLDELAILGLAELAASLTAIKERIEGRTAAIADGGFGGATVAALKKAIEKALQESAEEPAPEAPPVAGSPTAPPTPTAAAAPAAPPAAAPAAAPVAPPPVADGRLALTEAHLIALWRRSLYPIDGRGLILFGLRGCRPVAFDGAPLEAEQEITPATVDHQTMNCTLGHWLPGGGLAVFPGSTVPFGAIVANKVSANGVGVNQMGRGRYKSYVAGWHKRSEGANGHWALQQNTPITAQRTGDDAEYDLADRWEVGRQFGDNIHCAFHMGPDGAIPEARFSSAGCQTVAGTVRKGVAGSAAGPWARFIDPFRRTLGAQKEAEYVLFGADEAVLMMRTRYAGKSVILRFGSEGPLVAELQAALNSRLGLTLTEDGEFGPGTFQAVIDFQTATFGAMADDGVVGPGTAAALGVSLPEFDFDDAIGGGPGHAGPVGGPVGGPAAAPVTASGAVPAGTPIAFGETCRARHGQAFNDKVIAISNRIGCDPNHLMAVMAFETGEKFTPDVQNAAGSKATGLIQFMPKTARGLGTTIKDLAKMSAIDQLDFVEAHFRSIAGTRPLPTLSDLYMSVLLPVAVGKLDSHVLFNEGTKAYDQNKGLDKNRNGRITKAEAAAKVQAKLVLGLKDGRFG